MSPLEHARDVALEWLFQRDAEERAAARERDPAHAKVVAACLAGVDERLDLLGDVSDPEVALVSSAPLREATRLLIEASSARPGPLDAVEELARICSELRVSPATRAAGARLLAIDDPLALETLPRAELVASAQALEEIARALRVHVDGRSAAKIVWSRRRRMVLVTVLGVWALISLGHAIFGPKNVARGKPVLLSSIDHKGAAPEMLVDGVRSADTPLGDPHPDIVATQYESAPWAVIDLEREYKIREVRIFNRDDGSFDDGLPYAVDFSFDGKVFWEVGRCETHFGSWWIDPPCRVPCEHRITRFVRIRATHILALSEVEVYP